MKLPPINYKPLLEWMQLRKIWRKNLADTASRAGAQVSVGTVGKNIKAGKAFDGSVIHAWKEAYKWTDQETMHYCMNGDPPKLEASEQAPTIVIDLNDLYELVQRRNK